MCKGVSWFGTESDQLTGLLAIVLYSPKKKKMRLVSIFSFKSKRESECVHFSKI